MSNARSQCKALADHFKKPGARITQLEALRLYGIGRLAARIPETRIRFGLPIESHMISVIGSNGPARVAEYVLAKRESP